jgi:hypothetical protein
VLAVSACIGVVAWSRPLANSNEEASAERLYRNGMLPSGLPLVGPAAGSLIGCGPVDGRFIDQVSALSNTGRCPTVDGGQVPIASEMRVAATD